MGNICGDPGDVSWFRAPRCNCNLELVNCAFFKRSCKCRNMPKITFAQTSLWNIFWGSAPRPPLGRDSFPSLCMYLLLWWVWLPFYRHVTVKHACSWYSKVYYRFSCQLSHWWTAQLSVWVQVIIMGHFLYGVVLICKNCWNIVGCDEISTRLPILSTNCEIPYKNVASKHLWGKDPVSVNI